MLLSTLLAADMEARVCPSLAKQLHVRNAIKARVSLRVRVANGLIATLEAINFMHLPRSLGPFIKDRLNFMFHSGWLRRKKFLCTIFIIGISYPWCICSGESSRHG